jgi:hypothetical protein
VNSQFGPTPATYFPNWYLGRQFGARPGDWLAKVSYHSSLIETYTFPLGPTPATYLFQLAPWLKIVGQAWDLAGKSEVTHASDKKRESTIWPNTSHVLFQTGTLVKNFV